MFERFTAGARSTVMGARDEADELGHRFLGTEHVVLALSKDSGVAGAVLRESGATHDALRRALRATHPDDDAGIDADALRSIGIDLDDVRRSVEATFGDGALDERPTARGRRRWLGGGHVPFTKRAKKSLERALRQALTLGDSQLGSEHLLLGVLDEGGGLGARLLSDVGVDLGRLRATTVARSRRSA